MPGRFLTAEWRHLVLANWTLDPEILRPLVPRGTELDEHAGRTWISLVGFLFLDTRLLGVPVPGHRDFEEVNLRFYVRRKDPASGELRRAVVFVREIVPRAAIAATARWIYNERYVALPMRHEVLAPQGSSPGRALYGWTDGDRRCELEATTEGEPALPEPGSEAEFLAEHYWGYVTQRDGSTVEYRVEHPPWRVWPASSVRTTGAVPDFYGAPFAEVLSGEPVSAFVAEGSPVTVRKPRRLAD